MKEELWKKLVTDFPAIYSEYRWKPEIGDGWEPVLRRLSEGLNKLPEIPVLVQVKEKFGALRFYIGNGSDEAYRLINIAERESSVTCEYCDSLGELDGSKGWLKTVCPEHKAAR